MIFRNFPVYLILLQLLVLLRQILLQYFIYLFKPKVVGTFQQTYGFFLFLRRIFRLNYVLLLKLSKFTKWMDPPEGKFFFKSTRVDESSKEGESS